MTLFDKVKESTYYINSVIKDLQPQYGIILGTGLSGLIEDIEVLFEIEYSAIPHFPKTTVKSHEGKMIFGTLQGKNVVAMAGRFHYYEGYTMEQVTFPVRVMKYLEVERLFISNAAGGLQSHINAGDLVFVDDHINLHPKNPLRGANDEQLGPRFPDMLKAYDRAMNQKALAIAKENDITAHTGVYVGLQGPNLETPAEYRFMNIIGGDVVGMSTVPEVIVAKHMNLPIFVVSVVSNKCFPIEEITETTIDEVIAVVTEAEPKVSLIVQELIKG